MVKSARKRYTHPDDLKSVCINLAKYQIDLFKGLKEKHLIPSVSEGVRFVLWKGLDALYDMIERGERILNHQVKVSDGGNHNNDPRMLFIYVGGGKYKKFREDV